MKSTAERTLEELRAIITKSHIVYASGKHGSAYVNKDIVYLHPDKTSSLCFDLAQQFLREGGRATIVVAPAIGGIILGQWVAYHLGNLLGMPVLSAYAEKDGEGFAIKRGYGEHVRGARTLVVEDIFNTGGSAKATIAAVQAAGGDVSGVLALCNRGSVTAKDLGVPDVPVFRSLVDITLDAWDAAECPLCRDGVEINTTVGHGKKFLDTKK